MAKIAFQDIRFEELPDRTDKVRLAFLRIFEAFIEKAALDRIGNYVLADGAIDFPELSEKEAMNKIMPQIDNALKGLHNKVTKCKTIYVHKNSGIPLIGTLYFGIVDRGTNIIEIKPITGCNLDCTFCSVDQGQTSSKLFDFVVEDDYLVQETKKVIEYKQQDTDGRASESKIDVFINTHGEPLLYSNMVQLVAGLRAIKQIGTISIITNGTLLTKKLADELIEAGLNQLNLSLNSIDSTSAKKLAGTNNYEVGNVLDIARYLSKKIRLIIAPVWIKGTNDAEIPKIIAFAKQIKAQVGIQNYMAHKLGRKVAKEVEWDDFYRQLDAWEKESGADLRFKGHSSYPTRPLAKPFSKGDVVKAEIVCSGRMKKEMIAAAQGRAISVINCFKIKGNARVRILRDKDNVFVGEEV
jgi:hypothetical protein